MNRKIIAAALAVSTTMSLGASVLADGEISVLVNNEKVTFAETTPFIENERTLVPMREIFEALGAEVAWDGETRTIISYDTVSNTSITMQIDSNKMFVGETEVELEAPAKIVGSSTVVPVRAVAEGMDSIVEWDQETQTVIITKELEASDGDDTQIVNPWTNYETLDEINAAIQESGDVKFTIADLKTEGLALDKYRYLANSNLAEVIYTYTSGDDTAAVNVRTMSGDTDISGISGGTKVEEYLAGEIAVEIYTYEDTTYAIWTCTSADASLSHCVAVKAEEGFDAKTLIKTLVDDVEANYPKG